MVLGGYQVPKDTFVFMNHAITSRDPKVYNKPLEFIPERWLRGQYSNKYLLTTDTSMKPILLLN